MEKISIVIPSHNEERNLPSLISTLDNLRKRERWDCEIVIVDDNSTDSTGKVAEALSRKHKKITVIHRRGNPGMGNALKEGTAKSKGSIIIWTMADKSDNPETFPKMIAKINSGFDMVFGSRYIAGGSRGDLAFHKALLSRGYSVASKIIFGLKANDITNAFRCFRKEAFEKVKLLSGDFAISPEFAIKAHKAGFRLGEVPTGYSDRKEGKTTFKIMKMGGRYVSMFKYAFK